MSGSGWVTMGDVARAAGVSPMTVSRVLTAPALVRPATRAKVQAAVERLGYVRDAGAGALASRQTRLVAALVSTLSGSIFASTIAGLAATLRAAGHELLLGTTDYSPAAEEALLRATLARRPDGLVSSSDRHTTAARRLVQRSGVPLVEIWQLPERPIDMAVGFSNLEAGRAMTRFLAQAGHRRIAFLGNLGSDDRRGRRRHRGYLEVIEALGLGPPRTVGVAAEAATPAAGGGASPEDGALGLHQILQRWPDTEAVFCASDPIAIGAVMEAARRGLAVPDAIAIAGFGDFDYAGDAALGLTTVRIPGERIGAEAGRLLLERKAGTLAGPVTIDVGFAIIRRRTA